MELREAAARIVRQHWVLIVLGLVLGGAAAGVAHLAEHSTYTALARFVLDTPDPQSAAESAAIADTARAIATSPSQVAAAVREAGVSRDPVELARSGITVEALGSSGVLQLSVRDENPKVAAALANAVVSTLIRTRLSVSTGQVPAAVADLDARIDALNHSIATLDSKLQSLDAHIAQANNPDVATTLRAQRDDASQQRDYLSRQRVVLEGTRDDILANEALRPKPTVVNRAVPPANADPSRRLPDITLGALLGLILAIGSAALLETFQPTIVGKDAVAEAVDAPFLAELPGTPDRLEPADVQEVRTRIRLAASAAHVSVVELVPAVAAVSLKSLVTQLEQDTSSQGPRSGEARTDGADRAVASAAGEGAGSLLVGDLPKERHTEDVRVQALAAGMSPNGHAVGLVLVSPSVIRGTDLQAVHHLARITRWPVLGVVTYRSRRHQGWPRFRRLVHRSQGKDGSEGVA